MPSRSVYKSAAIEALDEFYSGTPEELERAFDDALALMDDDVPLWEVTRRHVDAGEGPALAAEDAEGFRDRWLADDSPLGGHEVGRVIRAAYREAVAMARRDGGPVPIETFWATGVSPEFEIHVCEGRGHVLVLWYLPLHRRYGSRRAASRSVVVRAHDTSEHEVVEEGDTPIVRLRASGSDGGAD